MGGPDIPAILKLFACVLCPATFQLALHKRKERCNNQKTYRKACVEKGKTRYKIHRPSEPINVEVRGEDGQCDTAFDISSDW